MNTALQMIDASGNPIDLMEQLAVQNEWLFDRAGEDEMHLSFPGRTEDHHLSFSWRGDVETLQLAAQLEIKVPKQRRSEIATLINMINEQLWLGHFEMYPDSGQIIYRHGLLLRGAIGATPEQCEALVTAALEACDRYFSAFQFVIWAGKAPKEALAAVLFETVGEA